MAREHHRLPQPGTGPGPWLFLALIAAVAIAVALMWSADLAGHALTGTPGPASPLVMLKQIVHATFTWATQAWWVLGGEVVLLLALAGLVTWLARRIRRAAEPIDRRARFMGHGPETARYTNLRQLRRRAENLGAEDAFGNPWVGVTVGTQVADGREFIADPEACWLIFAGPRAGKTSCLVIPAVLAAPGAVLVTTNKDARNDVYFATKDQRSKLGRVWGFDPQQLVRAEPSWVWDPLTYILPARNNPRYADALAQAEAHARKLAACFATGSRDGDSKTDAFFDPEGENLIVGFLLAAALDRRPVTDVFTWTTQPNVAEVAKILRGYGYEQQAQNVAAIDGYPGDQRGGVFGTAKKMVSSLSFTPVHPWVVADGRRPVFDPHLFARSTDTLYLLSKEGGGSCAPLVTALTMAVAEAAEEYAKEQGGRLRRPLLCVLDEAANVCLWRELPALYSHYGSRGILLMTFLQSWSQGVRVWGQSGMDAMYGAANIRVLMGNLSNGTDGFLTRVSAEIGDHDLRQASVNSSSTGSSRTVSLARHRILDVDALSGIPVPGGASPYGRAVVLASSARPTLLKTMRAEHRPALQKHLAAIDTASLQNEPA